MSSKKTSPKSLQLPPMLEGGKSPRYSKIKEDSRINYIYEWYQEHPEDFKTVPATGDDIYLREHKLENGMIIRTAVGDPGTGNTTTILILKPGTKDTWISAFKNLTNDEFNETLELISLVKEEEEEYNKQKKR